MTRADGVAGRRSVGHSLVLLGAACASFVAVGSFEAQTVDAAGPLVYPVPMLELDLVTNDIVWDPVHRVIYASVPSDDGSNGNSIAVIDPDRWEVIRRVPAGSEPNRLALSADSSMLYVGLDGAGAVRQFALPDLAPVRQFSLGNPFGTPNTASDMVVLADDPTVVVVSSSQGRRTVVYDDGTPRPDVVDGYHLERSADPAALWGIEQSSSYTLAKLAVSASGVNVVSEVGGLIPFTPGDFTLWGDKMFVSGVGTTQVINPEAGEPLGYLTAAGQLAVDTDAGIMYSAQARSATGQGLLRSYRDTLEVSSEFGLPIEHEPNRLVALNGGALALSSRDFVNSGAQVGKLYLLLPGLLRGAAGEFTSLSPSRLLDTRDGTGGISGALGAGGDIDVQVAGRNGIPATGVDAVVLNATVTGPTASGFVTIWPTGRDRPTISNLNFEPGQTVANLVTVNVGADGMVSVFNSHGATHVVLDVAGYYSTLDGAPGARYHSVSPKRLFDTRTGEGGVRSRLGPNDVVRFDVTGVAGVPADGTRAIVMNVAAVAPSASGYVTVSPGDEQRPLASNINFAAGRTTANLVTVRVPDSGVIEFFSQYGAVDLVADVVGYYDLDRSTEHGRLVSYQPYRRFDSRESSPFPGDGRLQPDSILILGGDDDPATAYVVNVTVTQPTSAGYLTAFPFVEPPMALPVEIPDASSVNFPPGATVPNMAIVPTGPQLGFYNSHGYTHLIVDVFGEFT